MKRTIPFPLNLKQREKKFPLSTYYGESAPMMPSVFMESSEPLCRELNYVYILDENAKPKRVDAKSFN